MKVTNNGHFTTIELETPDGQANFLQSLKSDIEGDRRTWAREKETSEMQQHIAANHTVSQFVVKAGDVFRQVKI
jgi:hypothetical protein